jgi:shikimate kinase
MGSNSGIKHLFLTGYMGSGKTTVGKLLSNQLSLPFYDLDHEIEITESLTIAEIFKDKGESYFRLKEVAAINALIQNNTRSIIALGGGAIINPDNLKTCNQNGLLIYLKGSALTIFNRLKENKSKRPLLASFKNDDQLKRFISTHLKEREPFYRQADFTIKVDNKNPEQVVNEIMNYLPQ